ncbi:MAG: excinuclease ABC subunit UvrC [Bacteriovoracaceae bacterium]|nr:excinuclease ABC subunit UvrC [Bacteriovoracaceae bacterium]
MTKENPRVLKLLEKAKSLPRKPGCYLMKSSKGKILYVGKAKDLKARVSSYFQKSVKSPKTEILVGHIREFEFLLTDTEAEALILENNLIKKHTPKYNIMMRDDKSYPYITIDFNEPFPRLQYQRKVKRGAGKKVFGPFVHGTNISDVLRILIKSFQLRDCTIREFHSRKEPCLLYQIKQCSAPCVGKISAHQYDEDLRLATNFFEDKAKTSFKILEERMHLLAESEEFEHAAMIRDNLEVLQRFMEFGNQENAEINGTAKNIDIVSYHVGEIEVDLAIYLVRNGLLLGHKNFHFPVVDCSEEIESEVINFIFQYYSSGGESLPEIIVTEFSKENNKLFQDALKSLASIKVLKPKTKNLDLTSLMNLTHDQAREHQRVRITNEDSVYVGLNKLKDLLGMKERPVVLECYDIAIFQGSSPTAAQIVFRDGRPDKGSYRNYHLTEREEGNNDFAMLEEVLKRRLESGELPDVFIVDGGKGQLSSFLKVLEEAKLDIPVCAIAKSKSIGEFNDEVVEKTEERLFIPNRANPYLLAKNKSLFRIITQMRDEAHRFSRRLHHKAEKKRTITSWVDQVEGVGPKMRKKILNNIKLSPTDLSRMEPEEISHELEVSLKIAKNILKVLRPN